MSNEDLDGNFGLTAEVIQERRRLLEQRLNDAGTQDNLSPQRIGASSTGHTGAGPNGSMNSPRAPTGGSFRERLPGNDQNSQRLRPVQLQPTTPAARAPAVANVGPRPRGNPDQEGIRMVPRPLPGYNSSTGAGETPAASIPQQAPPHAPEETKSFFSPSVMDYENQRYFLLAAFVLLQGFKLADVFAANAAGQPQGWGVTFDRVTRLIKWMLGDGLFLAAVKFLRVPKLTYPVHPTLTCCFALLAMLNIAVLFRHVVADMLVAVLLPFGTYVSGYNNSTSPSLPKETITKFPEPVGYPEELEIGLGSQKELSRQELLAESGHLLGKYTVKILPDSISKMNPDGLSFCMNQLPDNSYDGPVYIPVYINGTEPFQLRYTLTTMKGKQLAPRSIVLARFARSHLVDKEAKLVSGTYLLQADQPGRYTLNGVFTNEEYIFRQSPEYREVVVAPCPRASFEGLPPATAIPFCLGQKPVELSIEAKGISPFLVTYARQVNSSDIIVRVPGDKPWARDGVLPLEEITQKIALDTDIQKPGLYKFRLDSIEDRFNNKAQYNESALTTRSIRAHMLPTLRTSCDAAKHYSLSPKSPKARLALEFSGTAPFSAVLGLCTESEDAITDSCFISHREEVFPSSKGYFEVSTPGRYRILTLSDGNCPAALAASSSCVVAKVPPPTLQIKHEPIVSACQFEEGLKATLLMTGQPPFAVSFREIFTFKNGKSRTTERKVVAGNLQHHLELKPEESGVYTYEFHTLSSENYGEVAVSFTLRQVVHAQPSAQFSVISDLPARVCTGLPISSSLGMVLLRGMGPWTLDYTIFHNDQVFEKSLENITDERLSLPLGSFDSPGRYTIQLTRTSDGANCHNTLDTEPLIVEARSSRPSVEFQCGRENAIHALRYQEVTLPLSLTGEAPWDLKVVSPSSQTESVVIERNGAGFVTDQEGLYELISVSDSYCPGSVLEQSTCQVKWHPEPALVFPSQDGLTQLPGKSRFVQRGVCQGVTSNIALELTGRSPWDLAYTLSHPAIRHLPLELGAEQPNATGRLTLDTMASGLHTYTFHTVGDALYKRHKPTTALVLEQEIFPRPAAWFLTNSPLQLCADQKLENIELSLEGQAPFEVILEWRTPGAPPQQEFIQNIPGSTHTFSLAGRSPGLHSLRVVQVNDANGCVGGPDLSIDVDRPAVLRLEVVAPPTLQPISLASRRAHACVGDRLAYKLGGVSPWEVHYSVNDTARKAGQKEPSFRRLIDTPGTFQISQICHLPASGGCCAPPPEGLSQVIIHPLPGALIAGGSDKFVHMHDGEHKPVMVDLIGTPPFQFTYTRRSIATHELLETLTVQSISSHSHELDISLEGTYEIVEARDQFCQYPVPPNLMDLDESAR